MPLPARSPKLETTVQAEVAEVVEAKARRRHRRLQRENVRPRVVEGTDLSARSSGQLNFKISKF